MDIEQQKRIIELAFKWQQKHEWSAAFKAADNLRHHRDQASKDRVVVRRIQEGKSPSGQLDLFQHGAKRHEELSEFYHAEVIEAHNSFCELNNLLRSHAPTLLEYVPDVNFFEPDAIDYARQIRDLKHLEGAVRGMEDRWSNGRSKADWLELKPMTKDQWDAMREANRATRIQNVPGNQRLWQFRKSLCDERGFICPEFAEK